MARVIAKYSIQLLLILAGMVFYSACCTDCRFPFDNSNNPFDVRVYPADDYNELFTRYGGGWTGGNGGISLALSDGRVMWLFWDTFLDTVYADRSRPATAPRINNSIVIQNGNNLTTLYGGTEEAPTAYLIPPEDSLKYYPITAIETDNGIQIICAAIKSDYPTYSLFSTLKNIDVITLSKNDFSILSNMRKVTNSYYLLGAGIYEDEEYIYIQGTRRGERILARTNAVSLMNEWEYFTGSVWTTENDLALVYSDNSPDILNVIKHNDFFYMIINQNDDPWIINMVSSYDALGPWTNTTYLFGYDIIKKESYIFDPIVHWNLSNDNEVLVSFNIRDEHTAYTDADSFTIYFVWVENIW